MSQAVPSLHAFVRGRVQGVAYRVSTWAEANRLGLVGWVRNLPDRCVEVYAVGPETPLRELHRWLGQGPSDARVESVDATWGTEASPPGDFTIRS
jgi:acylphosphatase